MFSCLLRVNVRETLISIAVAAAFCLFEHPIAGASPPAQPPNTSAPGFIVLIQPVKVKIAYGETTLPVGMRLPVVSSDTTSVRVNYMGEVQTIPIAAARYETSTNDPPDAGAAPTMPLTSTKPASQPSSAPASQVQVSLQPGYDSRMQGGDITMRELQLLLSPYCTEAVDFSGAGTKIYNGVNYLMDSEQAVAALGLAHAIPSRVPLATPGFPKNSMYYIGYDGAFEGHLNRLYLVTDIANKVVAVQLLDEHPKGKWKSAASLAAASWSTYNFVNSRIRASDLMRVQAVAKRQGGVITIETQMYQRVRSRVGRKTIERYEEQENSKLFIPVPFARIILRCAQAGLSKA
ncbi:MAG: hypothetical protein DME32_13005 [Verrucomicrobia bacterium]|nr:MAG: hypothetical protein DME32_13005 [Verrucomicrobiota bacterium]